MDQLRRSLILAETNVAYGALRANGEACSHIELEREEWETTLADGLEEADVPEDALTASVLGFAG